MAVTTFSEHAAMASRCAPRRLSGRSASARVQGGRDRCALCRALAWAVARSRCHAKLEPGSPQTASTAATPAAMSASQKRSRAVRSRGCGDSDTRASRSKAQPSRTGSSKRWKPSLPRGSSRKHWAYPKRWPNLPIEVRFEVHLGLFPLINAKASSNAHAPHPAVHQFALCRPREDG